MFIYILRLDQGKYYIGRTKNVKNRVRQHVNKNGSFWTKKYIPIGFVEEIESDDPFDEDKYVLRYMSIYGIDNVRGGSFCEIVLQKETKSFIQKMLRNASNCCFKCGEEGHFAKDCYVTLKESFREIASRDVEVQTEPAPSVLRSVMGRITSFAKNIISNM